MVSIPAFQAGGPGSIPGQRNYRAISLAVMIPRCQRGGPGSTPGWRIFFLMTSFLISENFFYFSLKKIYEKKFSKWKLKTKIISKTAPLVGFEPTTPGLEVRCAIRCATEAKNDPGGTRTHNR